MKGRSIQTGVAYFGNRFVNHARDDMARIAECCTYVVHTFSEQDLYFHKQAMESIFSETKKNKMDVWVDPWGVGGVFGGESFSKFLLDNRRAWQILSNGESVQSACLNNTRFRAFMKEWVTNVKDLGADVILWDEPHIYLTLDAELDKVYTCVCPVCKEQYERTYGHEMPSQRNQYIQDFRVRTMKDFLRDCMGYARKKGIKNALTIYALTGIPEYDRVWEIAGSLPEVDIFGCDPYWRWNRSKKPVEHVGYFAYKVAKTCWENSKEPHVWIQAMKLAHGYEHEIGKAIDAAYENAVRNFAAWSFDGGALLDNVSSSDPETVWKEVRKAFMRIRRKKE
ncbi:MAG: hypothetical protein GF384_09005 [Elusimicrobia bacterium]|nr:hypothetical protein [Elusimicrobiota bacterium]MBD3412728.1 hypothetical protein [Elusimicrobiota bacterium]